MSEEFVRKEVFDARMDRMEALLEKMPMAMKADNEKLRSEVKEEVNGLRNEMNGLRGEMRENTARLETRIEVGNARIDAVNMRIDGLQTTIYWGFAIVAIVLAFLPTIQDWRKMFRKPPVTMEDVEKTIAAAMANRRSLTRGHSTGPTPQKMACPPRSLAPHPIFRYNYLYTRAFRNDDFFLRGALDI